MISHKQIHLRDFSSRLVWNHYTVWFCMFYIVYVPLLGNLPASLKLGLCSRLTYTCSSLCTLCIKTGYYIYIYNIPILNIGIFHFLAIIFSTRLTKSSTKLLVITMENICKILENEGNFLHVSPYFLKAFWLPFSLTISLASSLIFFSCPDLGFSQRNTQIAVVAVYRIWETCKK